MSLEVIGAGFGRTGTISLKAALESLGFSPCYHMREARARPEDALKWLHLARTGEVDWADLLAGFPAAIDWPAARYWRELGSAFPTAKVILSRRDTAGWLASMQQTILQVLRNGPDAFPPELRDWFTMTYETIALGEFGGEIEDETHLAVTYERHNETVIAELSADRLLVFEARDGWAPLCRFLARPVPPEPFPRANSSAEFRGRFRLAD